MIHLDSYRLLREYQQADQHKSDKYQLALVPTMGHFHPGHLSLIEEALQQAHKVMISIYVNPTQFNQPEDYSRYPRTLASDLEKLAGYPDVIVFTPSDLDIYPRGIAMDCNINPPRVANILEGEYRLGHFTGVTTVVAKLLNLIQPQLLILGKKDYQQLRVLEKMVTEMRYTCQVFGAETVREESGLAYSSRNQRLTKKQREIAPALYQTLNRICQQLKLLGWSAFDDLAEQGLQDLSKIGFTVEYLQLRDQHHLRYATPQTSSAVLLIASWLGEVRLIDSIEVSLPLLKPNQ